MKINFKMYKKLCKKVEMLREDSLYTVFRCGTGEINRQKFLKLTLYIIKNMDTAHELTLTDICVRNSGKNSPRLIIKWITMSGAHDQYSVAIRRSWNGNGYCGWPFRRSQEEFLVQGSAIREIIGFIPAHAHYNFGYAGPVRWVRNVVENVGEEGTVRLHTYPLTASGTTPMMVNSGDNAFGDIIIADDPHTAELETNISITDRISDAVGLPRDIMGGRGYTEVDASFMLEGIIPEQDEYELHDINGYIVDNRGIIIKTPENE